MPLENIRIVISGPNASGKTTLARAISEKYQVKIIQENLQAIIKARVALHKTIFAQAKENLIKEARKVLINEFMNWLRQRDRDYKRNNAFVADRWEADLLDMWLVFMRNEVDVDDLTGLIVKTMTERAENINLAIIMPLAQPMSLRPNEDSIKRNSTLTNRLLNSMLTKGIIQSLPKMRVLKMPHKDLSVYERLSLVDQFIYEMR